MYRMVIGLFLVLNLFACDSITVWIIERHNCTKFWHFGKWTWRVESGGTIEIDRDTVCKIYAIDEDEARRYNTVPGKWLFWCDSVDIVRTRFYPDSSFSVLREE